MGRLVTLIAENIAAVIGFALYGGLLYYIVAGTLRRYTGKKSRRSPSSSKWGGRNKPIQEQDSPEAALFFSMFHKNTENPEQENQSRKDFSKDIPTANSYIHRKSEQS